MGFRGPRVNVALPGVDALVIADIYRCGHVYFTMGTTLNALIALGFTITHVEEWGPTAEQIAALPELAEERERPPFLLVAARL